ncbi:hypothetical protein CapIbe_000945 [Capra ibex]
MRGENLRSSPLRSFHNALLPTLGITCFGSDEREIRTAVHLNCDHYLGDFGVEVVARVELSPPDQLKCRESSLDGSPGRMLRVSRGVMSNRKGRGRWLFTCLVSPAFRVLSIRINRLLITSCLWKTPAHCLVIHVFALIFT